MDLKKTTRFAVLVAPLAWLGGGRSLLILLGWAVFGVLSGCGTRPAATGAPMELVNVSYDVSRELFAKLNVAARPWLEARLGHPVTITQSHAGASKQARSILDGVDADLVTLNTVSDVDFLARRGRLLPDNWRTLRPYHSAPYSSVVVFVVRKGNPKGLRDWADLMKPGVQLVLANPKTSGTARLVHLSAWAFARGRHGGNEARAREFLAEFYGRAPVLDTGARGATITFVQRQVGDVLLTLEAEQHIVAQEYPDAGFEVVYPSLSVDAEMPAVVVQRLAAKRGTEAAANAYLDFLYTPEAQTIMARNGFRPNVPGVRAQFVGQFPEIQLVEVDRDLGGWETVMRTHFAEGGVFDLVYDRPSR